MREEVSKEKREEEEAVRWRRNKYSVDSNLLGSLRDHLSCSVSMTTLMVVATGSLQQHGRQLYLLLLLRHRQPQWSH